MLTKEYAVDQLDHGHRVVTPSFCASCGAPRGPNDRFCESCGVPLAQGEEQGTNRQVDHRPTASSVAIAAATPPQPAWPELGPARTDYPWHVGKALDRANAADEPVLDWVDGLRNCVAVLTHRRIIVSKANVTSFPLDQVTGVDTQSGSVRTVLTVRTGATHASESVLARGLGGDIWQAPNTVPFSRSGIAEANRFTQHVNGVLSAVHGAVGAPEGPKSTSVALGGPPGQPHQAQGPDQPIDNSRAWLLVGAPLLLLCVDAALVLSGIATGSTVGVVIAVAVNAGIVTWDWQYLKRRGITLNPATGYFLVPLYLYLRASRLQQAQRMLAAWIVALVVSIAGTAYLANQFVNLDMGRVKSTLAQWVTQRTGVNATISCPNRSVHGVHDTFICTVSAGGQTVSLQVTVQNSGGDITWHAVGVSGGSNP